MLKFALGTHRNAALLSLLSTLAARDRATTAELLAVIGEVDARRLHRGRGYGSMYRYCLGVLHMSEDMAFKRIQVARAARKFPALLEMIADGRLHLSGAILLVPRLVRENVDLLLAEATNKTKREIKLVLAKYFPEPDVETVIVPVSTRGAGSAPVASAGVTVAAACAAAPAPSAATPAEAAAQLVPEPVAASPPQPQLVSAVPVPQYPRVEPLSPGRHVVQVTVDQETHDLLRYAQALLSDAVPDGSVPETLKRALRALVDPLERRKFGVGARLRSVKDPKDPRYTSPADRCEVVVKDEGACTFVGDGGHRCGARTQLRFHHKIPFAKGGPNTAENLTLHCAAHDQLMAEREYGEAFVQAKIEAARQKRSARAIAPAAYQATATSEAQVLAAARHARARGLAPADVLGSRAAAAEGRAKLDELLAGPAHEPNAPRAG